MRRILFYYPSNKRSVQIESTIKTLKELGHTVLFLTTCEYGALHEKLKKENVSCFSNPLVKKFSFSYYLSQLNFLVKFSNKNKIDLVYSNLQHTNFIAVFAQYFLKAKVVIFRHHFKFNKGHFGIPLKVNKNEVFFDKIINFLSKLIIVPSSGVYNGMLKHENVKASKVKIIPYLYEFSRYEQPCREEIEKIKATYPAKLRLIMVARLIPFKRHAIIFKVVKKLIKEGLSINLLVLDEGPEEDNLKRIIFNARLEDRIFMIGYKKNILDYMAASDLLIHPSLTEASNSVVKEMGLLTKPVAVCQGVGDFDDYIVDGKNSFVMDLVNPENDAEEIIRTIYNKPEMILHLGKELHQTVLEKFSSNEKTIEKYKKLISDY